jgi:hypothetical protein
MGLEGVTWVGDDDIGTYLVIEASVVIKIIEIGREGFSTPKFHISDLKVVVDYPKISTRSGGRRDGGGRDIQVQRLCVSPSSSDRNSIEASGARYSGCWVMNSIEGKGA